jgi:site-specific DNA recombinase
MAAASPRGKQPDSMVQSGYQQAVLYLRVSTKEQAMKGGESEGYSIPAQREACRKKADSLGAVIAAEFVDPGNTGRTANRPGLQALLSHIKENPTKYVIVHKLDRLARDMGVHTTLWKQLEVADSLLVSCTEPLDGSTSYGKYIRTLMAANATFFSDNLGDEVRKGLQQKVLMGGTPGYCRLGYLNTTTMINGQPVKGIELDPERAPHLHWMFRTFERGAWSITDIVAELERRGMRNRPTATRPGKPLTRSQVHRILTNPYYIGKLPFKGVIYEGRHPPLIDERTFHHVQQVLSGRRIAGDRSWRHEHYLKGSLFCARCQSRLGFGISRGKTGQHYPYFFCLGRHTKRTSCDLPYLPVDAMEEQVLKHWRELKVTPDLIAHTRASVKQEMSEQHASDKKLIITQTRRIQRLEDRRQKLIDAYLDGAITLPDLKSRQTALDTEQQEARRLLSIATINTKLIEERLEIALLLLEHCERLYTDADDNSRRSLNQAFFAELQLDHDGVKYAILNSPFIELLDRTIGLRTEGDVPDAQDDDPDPPPGGSRETTRRPTRALVASRGLAQGPQKNPETFRPRGSNVALMAEGEGFEPSTDPEARNGFRDETRSLMGNAVCAA